MPKKHDPNTSLSDQATFQGQAKPKLDDFDTHSLGDQATFAGDGGNDYLDDGMEIVDLETRYKIEKTLGKGGMGEVLLANDTRLNRKVAIKRILKESSRSSTAISRFLTEAKSIAALNHPNIVHIYDYGRSNEGPFLIMEYVEGGNLLDRCRNGAIPIEEAIHLACQLCEGLGRAHERGIIHRDIKPANILLTTDGIPKLTDFGLAKAETEDTGITITGSVLGTLDFMPPEQRRDASLVDARSDLWSLVATLYQMVTGESPRVIDLDSVPKELRSPLARALKTKKEDRYQTAIELKAALNDSLVRSKPSPSSTVDDLGMGECPTCHTLNEPHRKFCRECGDPLRCKCLKCEHDIPVWDKVCPECGGKQPELFAARVQKIDEQRAEAERLATSFCFPEALAKAEKIYAISDNRLKHQHSWVESFSRAVNLECERQEKLASELFKQSLDFHSLFDFDSAIGALEKIPKPLRGSLKDDYLIRLRREKKEVDALLVQIRTQTAENRFEGLLSQVEKAISLCGEREDLVALRNDLRDRETRCRDAYQIAENQLAEGLAKQALKAIASIEDFNLPPKQSHLRNHLQNLVTQENEIAAIVREMKAKGDFDRQSILLLYQKVTDYLELNPAHPKMINLKDDLNRRLINFPITDLSKLPPSALQFLHQELGRRLPPLSNSIGMFFNIIPSGSFTMGEGNEAHVVTLKRPFYLGLYPVTQEQYERVIRKNPSQFNGRQNPVETVCWEDAVEFCNRLSSLPEERDAGRVYRLPTEAEWEYACRAGSNSAYCFGDDESQLGEYAWFKNNSDGSTHSVGQKKSNVWGLYDMHGNVWEWCADSNSDTISDFVKGSVDPHERAKRVLRGGCWGNGAASCQSTGRYAETLTSRSARYGFRVVVVFC
jgi:serine/threonine protein kinase/formylglycine-generating enzyme required for sulfatase activity